MNQLKFFFIENKKRLFLLCALFTGVLFVEFFVFNSVFFIQKIFNLQERRYTIDDGSLYQFDLENGELVAGGVDPNLTIDGVDLRVGSVAIKCVNTMDEAVGQVFYRSKDEEFSESHSVIYNVSVNDKELPLGHILEIPRLSKVYGLRFDLTNIFRDRISCSEFVINPPAQFVSDIGRFAGYVGVLLLGALFVFIKDKLAVYTKSLKAISISFFLALSIILGIKLSVFAISQNVVFLVAFCILLFSFAMTYTLIYVYTDFKPMQDARTVVLGNYKYEIAITIVALITTLPLLTEPYFYFDDYWGAGNKSLLTKESLITFARPIQLLIYAVFDYIGIRNAHMFKWVFLPALILYAIVLYRWLTVKTQDHVFAFLLASVLTIFAPAMDLLGYTATSAVCYSFLFSALSVVYFEYAYTIYLERKRTHLLLNSILAFLFLFLALLTYQVGTQIVFVFLSIGVYFNIKKEALFKKNLVYLFFFGSANVFYLIFIKLLNLLYQVGITTNRSQTINSLVQVKEKIIFYKFVIVQSVNQVVASFSGGDFILERYHGYAITFANQLSGNLLFLFVSLMVCIALADYWLRTKNILGLLSLIAFVPMSFFVFLVLAESGYLTYYAFAHICLVMFYFVMGLIVTVQFLWKTMVHYGNPIIAWKVVKPGTVLAPLLVVCALVSNYYIRDFYVNFNSTVYNFVKYNLQTAIDSGDIRRVHVNGTISPLNADIYSRFVVETALKDLEENKVDFEITFSANKYFLERVQKEDYLRVFEGASEDDKQLLEKIYLFGATYNQYNILTWPSQDEQKRLQQMFMKAGFIPTSTSPNVLIIDLTWTDEVYYNR